ncbi:capsid staple protein [Pseudoxanthomonas sp. X-1]|uniref:capsid staple protein n=2 Tax=Pseudoxanthomonas sp. X-1 TaxID=2571115 RepID=UPI00110A9290|nr:hypothetical protein [Pseudoxanthomonas sp. X-1]
MKLVSMKKTDEEEKKEASSECCGDYKEPDYPWGLRVRLEDEQLEALGIGSMPPVGAPMELQALAKVISVSEEQVEGKPKRCLELQITDLAVGGIRMPIADRLFAKGAEQG